MDVTASSISGGALPGQKKGPGQKEGSERHGRFFYLISAAWIFFLFGTTSSFRPLFPGIYNIERYIWGPADLAAIICLLLFPAMVFKIVNQNKLLFSWGIFASASFLWSLTPVFSLYQGIQLVMTILVALLLSATRTRKEILVLLFGSLVLVTVLSVMLVVVKPGWAVDYNGAWQGSLTHKNQLGTLMALQVITGLVLFLSGWRRNLSGAAILLALLVLALSQSKTSIVSLLLVLPFILLAIAYRHNRFLLLMIAGLVLVGGGLAVMLVTVFEIDVLGLVLKSAGKDATLTGRVEVWAFGTEAIGERFWLGTGFRAYWQSSQTTYLNLQFILRQELHSFHNTYIETTVALGVAGLTLMVVTLLAGCRHAVEDFFRYKTYTSLWPLLFLVYLSVYMLAETAVFLNHSYMQFMLVVALSAREQGYHKEIWST